MTETIVNINEGNLHPVLQQLKDEIVTLKQTIDTLQGNLIRQRADHIGYKQSVHDTLLHVAKDHDVETIAQVASKLDIDLTRDVEFSATITIHVSAQVPFYLDEDEIENYISNNIDIDISSGEGWSGWVDDWVTTNIDSIS